jgi:hypothetical protein
MDWTDCPLVERVPCKVSGAPQPVGCMAAIFAASVLKLHQDGLLDTTVVYGDGTTTAAKKGGDNIGFSGHKKVKGDKQLVAGF